MRIPDLYARPETTISFEFFPPKNDAAEEALFRDVVPGLKVLGPAYISVTYGAGGGTRERSFRIVDRLRREHGIEALAHLTCVGSTRADSGTILDEAEGLGIENILALRGDPPRGETEFHATPGGFSHAVDLVRFIKDRNSKGEHDFAVGVAGYPEGHVECPDRQLDWDRCAAKAEAGAEFIITQLFYDLEDFLAFRDYLTHRRGVRAAVVPGLLPFLSAEQIKRFTRLCGSKLPEDIVRRMEAMGDDESVRQLGVEVCTDLGRRLLEHGAPGLHFYCLNRVPSCSEILHNLGLVPGTPA